MDVVSGALAGIIVFTLMLSYTFVSRRYGFGPDLWQERPKNNCIYCGEDDVIRTDPDGDAICELCTWEYFPKDYFV